MMQKLKNIPFFLLLVILFFCLHGYVQAPNFLNFSDLVKASINVSVVFVIFYLIIFLFTRNHILSSFVCFYFEIWYLFFGAIQDSLKPPFRFSFLSKYSVLVPLAIIIGIIFVKYLKRKKHLWPKFIFYINILFSIYLLVDLIQLIIIRNTNSDNIYDTSLSFNYNKVINKPDVYLLLFDGYPSNYELKKYFNFDNNSFNNEMEKKEFKSIPISSNYDITFYSMASLFNMQYIKEKYGTYSQNNIGKRLKEIQQGYVFSVFKKMGYDIENNSVFDINNIPSKANDNRFLNGGGALLTDKLFVNRFRKDVEVGIFAKLASKFSIFQNLSMYKNRNDNEKLIQNLKLNASIKKSKPIFSYTHVLMPHEPFYYDSLGNKIDFLKNDFEHNINVNGFVSYLKYTNKVIDTIITTIKLNKPNAIIVLLSDHGQRGVKNITIEPKDKLCNICHIYLPNREYDKYTNLDTITNVNLFRNILNTQFNQNMSFLPDSSFFINDKF